VHCETGKSPQRDRKLFGSDPKRKRVRRTSGKERGSDHQFPSMSPAAAQCKFFVKPSHRTSFVARVPFAAKRPTPNAARRCPPFKSSTAFRALSSCGLFPWVALLQNIPEASPCFSVSEKLARYISSPLSSVEHLSLLVGKGSVALDPSSTVGDHFF
jgi:hypothetical protein